MNVPALHCYKKRLYWVKAFPLLYQLNLNLSPTHQKKPAYLKSAALTSFSIFDVDLTRAVKLALEGAARLCLVVHSAPKKCLAGKATMAAIMNMPEKS